MLGAVGGRTRKDLFISYAAPDRPWADWVAWHLQAAGFEVELDARDWAAGDNVVVRMRDALDAADGVIALFSPAYFEDTRYTTDEWSAALVRAGDGGHRLIPLQVEPCRVPRLLGPLLRVELHGIGETEAVRRLLDAVQGPQAADDRPAFPASAPASPAPRLPGTLPTVWNVGPRNQSFVGRDGALAGIRARLRSGGTAVGHALHGLGGVGKTQLAIEYAHRHAALARALDLTAPYADTAAAVNAVHTHLRSHTRWLLALDNAESPADLRDWLPAGPGHTLITSRDPGWGELAGHVEVDVLSRAESVALLRTHRPGLGDADADLLAGALGDLPLALAQAAGSWPRRASRPFSTEACWPPGPRSCSTRARPSAIRTRWPPPSGSPPTAWPRSIRRLWRCCG
jgi:hypothetical protein